MTDDLVTWLRAQLDDDERAARAWLPLGNPTAADREHIARHDPARVLAEVDAKRRIIDEHEPYPQPQRMATGEILACSTCGSVDDSPVEWPCPTVRLLALPYADRAGYRDEWRP
ncbi:DUF6221 family protein [Micromonospora sp. WMMD1128]|uniref:DUF6221 family protein n=1 Tax=Micromonospora sp. WMMD1128 TaxID=3015150 RepID=UPI00248B65B6|nr:DUF6221 family protein [Micromonospora sp. WMMD1128]WBB73251.1 DUF6221 family protein [Micromonospora sp. WMMD1128]